MHGAFKLCRSEGKWGKEGKLKQTINEQVVMLHSTRKLRSLYKKKQHFSHWSTVSELDSFWEKHVIYDVRSFIRLKTTWLLQYLVQTERTSVLFPLQYVTSYLKAKESEKKRGTPTSPPHGDTGTTGVVNRWGNFLTVTTLLFIYVICAAAVFLTCSQQHGSIGSSKSQYLLCRCSSVADLFHQDQTH